MLMCLQKLNISVNCVNCSSLFHRNLSLFLITSMCAYVSLCAFYMQ